MPIATKLESHGQTSIQLGGMSKMVVWIDRLPGTSAIFRVLSISKFLDGIDHLTRFPATIFWDCKTSDSNMKEEHFMPLDPLRSSVRVQTFSLRIIL